MKTKHIKLREPLSAIVTVLSVLLFTSCRQGPIAPGGYQVAGIQFNHTVQSDFFNGALPVFDFRENGVLHLSSDLPGGFFTDSVYTYSYRKKEGVLVLKGDKTSYRLICEPEGGHSFTLFVDSELIRVITLRKSV